MKPAELAIDALAAARLTRLVTTDTITRPLRARIIRWAYEQRDGTWIEEHPTPDDVEGLIGQQAIYWEEQVAEDDEAPRLAELVTCPACAGLWIALGITAARRYAPGAWEPLARALATAAAARLISRAAE